MPETIPFRPNARRRLLLGLPLMLLTGIGCEGEPRLIAPNVVPINDRLWTAGQPGAKALAGLSAMGFRAVIYLAPPTVPDAVREEPAILAAQGIEYLNIPIPFDAPEPQHFTAFVAAMKQFGSRKLLVHCQANLRASSMTFLHRVLVGRENPERAYEAVSRVWSPDGAWKPFIQRMLDAEKIAFEVF